MENQQAQKKEPENHVRTNVVFKIFIPIIRSMYTKINLSFLERKKFKLLLYHVDLLG